MTKAEETVLKTVHDLGVASALDVQNYTGLSAGKAIMVDWDDGSRSNVTPFIDEVWIAF